MASPETFIQETANRDSSQRLAAWELWSESPSKSSDSLGWKTCQECNIHGIHGEVELRICGSSVQYALIELRSKDDQTCYHGDRAGGLLSQPFWYTKSFWVKPSRTLLAQPNCLGLVTSSVLNHMTATNIHLRAQLTYGGLMVVELTCHFSHNPSLNMAMWCQYVTSNSRTRLVSLGCLFKPLNAIHDFVIYWRFSLPRTLDTCCNFRSLIWDDAWQWHVVWPQIGLKPVSAKL